MVTLLHQKDIFSEKNTQDVSSYYSHKKGLVDQMLLPRLLSCVSRLPALAVAAMVTVADLHSLNWAWGGIVVMMFRRR